jgi:hypothetical protein
MSGLSEVSILLAQRASDLVKAREVFTSESRNFVTGVLGALVRMRQAPWMGPRIRLDMPKEIERESKAAADITEQYAIARVQLRFKRGVSFTVVADIRFGIEFDEEAEKFCWSISLIPASRFQRMDDLMWAQYKSVPTIVAAPGATHQERANTIRFALRPVDQSLTSEVAFNDVKAVLEFVMGCDAALASAVGVDLAAGEEQ